MYLSLVPSQNGDFFWTVALLQQVLCQSSTEISLEFVDPAVETGSQKAAEFGGDLPSGIHSSRE